MTEPLLAIHDLHVVFDADDGVVEAVRGATFDIYPGETVAVVGESGSGKTVISQAVLGILPHHARLTQGKMLFRDPASDGEAVDLVALGVDSPERRALRGGRMSIIFQEPMSSLSPLHTIGDQISEAFRLHSPDLADRARERTIEMLDRVGFARPSQAVDTYPFELSGGMRQRAMIAMALICRPALLIADEPTTALDVTIQAQILSLMKDLQQELGMAILFITHDLGVVANIADEMVVLYRGKVMERGSCHDLFEQPGHPYLKGLLEAVPRVDLDPATRLKGLRDIPVHAQDTLKRFWPVPEIRDAARANKPLLSLEGVSKIFFTRTGGPGGTELNRIVALDDVGFEVMPGETFAIVGESGSGKTTISKVIMRAIVPDSGTIVFNPGEPVDVLGIPEQELQAFRRQIQYVFQDPYGSLNPRMTVFDIIAEPLVIHQIGDDAERAERVRALMAAVGLNSRHAKRYPHSFSGGQRQRIGIARSLALEPKLLICDEPVSALDVSIQAQILNLLKDLQKELGLTYLFISHNMAVVKYVAHRIGVMSAGRLVEVAPCDQLFANPQHPYTKALLAAVPEPDLDHPLMFDQLVGDALGGPANWPEPFTLSEGSGMLRRVSAAHFVRLNN